MKQEREGEGGGGGGGEGAVGGRWIKVNKGMVFSIH